MPTKPMTDKQQDTWSWIKEYRGTHGYSPTIHEIRVHFNLASTNAVAARLDAMERAGWMRTDPNLSQRAMIPIEANQATTTTPTGEANGKRNRDPGNRPGNRRPG